MHETHRSVDFVTLTLPNVRSGTATFLSCIIGQSGLICTIIFGQWRSWQGNAQFSKLHIRWYTVNILFSPEITYVGFWCSELWIGRSGNYELYPTESVYAKREHCVMPDSPDESWPKFAQLPERKRLWSYKISKVLVGCGDSKSSETSFDGSWGSEFVKCSVGILNPFVMTERFSILNPPKRPIDISELHKIILWRLMFTLKYLKLDRQSLSVFVSCFWRLNVGRLFLPRRKLRPACPRVTSFLSSLPRSELTYRRTYKKGSRKVLGRDPLNK